MMYFNEDTDPLLYACPCGRHTCEARINPRMPTVLNVIRDAVGFPITISSGPRCVPHNIEIGGAEYSEHVDGEGVDIPCSSSRHRFLIIKAAIDAGINRIGIGKNFIHLGISTTNDPLVMWVY